MATAYAYVTGTGNSSKLAVQTYDSTFKPVKLVNIDTVSNSGSLGAGNTYVTATITDVSVTSNPDGSFAVFWTDNQSSIAYGSLGQPVSGTVKYTSYEQSYSASGTPGTKRTLNQATIANVYDETAPDNVGDVNNKGGIADAVVSVTSTGAALSVQTYDSNFKPQQLINNIDTVSNSGSFGAGDTSVTGAITDVSVTSNPDGSFAVFWTDSQNTVTYGSFDQPVSSNLNYTSYEQSYSANGAAGTKRTLNQGMIAGAFDETAPDNAGDVNNKGGIADAVVSTTSTGAALSVQTYDSNFKPQQLINNIDTVSNSGSYGDGDTSVTAAITNVSVTSNPDGSFAVFWTDNQSIVTYGSLDQPVSSNLKYISYEQSFSANGMAGTKLILKQTTIAGDYDETAPASAGDAGSFEGIDYRYAAHVSSDPISLTKIENSGFGFVGEYIGNTQLDSSYLTASKASNYITQGLNIFSIYETAGMGGANWQTYYSQNQGFLDGFKAYVDAEKYACQASGSAIYFGIDIDPGTSSKNLTLISNYCTGIAQGFALAAKESQQQAPIYDVGVYGAGITLQTIKDNLDLADYGWLAESSGWTESKTYTGWDLKQITDPSLKPLLGSPSNVSYVAGDVSANGSFGEWNTVGTSISPVANSPSITGATPVGASHTAFSVHGSADPYCIITLRDGAKVLGTSTTDVNGAWSINATFGTGVHPLTATETDPSGDVSSPSTTFSFNISNVASGQTSSAVTLAANDVENVLADGKVVDASVGGVLNVLAGGAADPTTIGSGGIEVIAKGGADLGALVSGGEQDVFGYASGATVFTGAQIVESGGTAIGTIVSSGGTLELLGGAIISSFSISSGGVLEIASGYELKSDQVSSGVTVAIADGGVLNVLSGGIADPTIFNGGTEVVSAHGTDDGADISGGRQVVYGTTTWVTVFSGTQVVEAGGVANNTTVSGAGVEVIVSGGTAIGGASVAGGVVTVSSGGTFEFTSGTTAKVNAVSGAILEVASGYVFGGSIGAGVKLEVLSGGVDSGAAVSSGGSEIVLSGGTASNTRVLKGGFETVSSGGNASGTMVSSGGTEIVSAHGTDNGGQISGGRQLVYGVASGVTVFAGSQIIEAGGSVTSTTVSNGGSVTVLNGGAAAALTIFTGGTAIASGGGSAGISGATSGRIEASGKGAQVQLDNAVVSGGTLSAGSGAVITTSAGSVDSIIAATIAGSSLVEVASGSTLTLRGGTVRLGAVLETLSGGTAILSGTVNNSGTFFASGSGSLVEIGDGAVVSGGLAEVGNGIVEIQGGSSENVTFQADGSGGLDLDDALAYTGKVSGFGMSAGISHADHAQYIDLTSVNLAPGQINLNYTPANASNTSGTLVVTSGGTKVANVAFAGTYVTSNLHVSSGVGGTVEITDPAIEEWAHKVSGDWTTASDWTPSVVPGANNNVAISLAGPYTVTSLADETVNSLLLGAEVSLDVGGGSGFVALTGITNSGAINVGDNSIFETGGTSKNLGTMTLDSTGDTTNWVIDGNVTLGGGGKVHLVNLATSLVSYGSTAAAIASNGSTSTLTNVNNTIYGNGTIGDANLTVINQSLGVIEAAAKQSLTIAGAVTNSGNIESDGSLEFDSDGTNNTGGNIRALATGASIFMDGATITGGTISTVAGSTLTGNGVSELDGAAISNAGDLAAALNSTFTINSSITNNGVLQAAGNLVLNGAVTGTGSATIVGTGELKIVSAFAENISFATNSTGTLILDTPAALSGTIHGFDDGTIDLPNISFGTGTTFSYTPNANNTGGTLHVSDGTHSANIGLFGHFQAVGFQEGNDGAGGTLIGYAVPIFWNSGISGNFATASNWSPADIPGSGNAAIITAAGTYTVTSSLNETVYSLTTATGATLEVAADTFTVTNQAGAVTNAGTIAVDSAGILAIDQGVIKNTGTVAISGALNFGSYPSSGNVTLQGGGNVTLIGTNAQIADYGTNATLTNVDNTISGVGYLNSDSTLINQSSGIIDAIGSGSPNGNNFLSIGARTLNNAGTIESTGYGYLAINVNSAGNLNNSGTIEVTSDVGAYGEITGPVVNTGNIEVLGAANVIINGAVMGTGNETVNDGALTLDAAVSAGQGLTFSGSSGALTLDDAPDFAGTIAGFALGNSIDLTTINHNSSSFNITYTANQNDTGGVLSLTDGTNSAAINIVGSYTQANFIANTDGSVGTLITDPPVIDQPPGGAVATIANDTVLEVNVADSGNVTFVGATGTLWLDQPATFTGTVAGFGKQDRIDLATIGFGPHTTLGYSENDSHTGGTLTVTDGTHAAAIALLGNYIASTLVTGADGHGGTLVTEAPQPGQPPLLTHPHA